MKKFLFIGAVMMLMASCGSSESTKETVEAPDSFGYEMPPEAIELPEEYEGTGNMSDADEKANSNKSVGDTEEVSGKEKVSEVVKKSATEVVESTKEKAQEIGEKAKEEIKTVKEAAREAGSKVETKAKELGKVTKESLN